MKILLDTIDTKIIKKYSDSGILYGVTTNPTLAKRFGMADDITMINKIRKAMPEGEIHVEAFGDNAKEIIQNAKRIQSLSNDNDLVFKVPFSLSGVHATKHLRDLGLKTNLHLIFSVNQSLIASEVSSSYICPLVGRLDDIGHDAFDNLSKIISAYNKNKVTTKVMVSSVRNPQHVQKAFMLGADVVTIPPAVLDKMFNHPLTKTGYEAFHKDIKMMQILQSDDIEDNSLVSPNLTLEESVRFMNMHKINVITANYGNKPGIYTMGDFKRLLVESNFDLKQKLKLPITKFLNFEPVKIDVNQCYEDAKLLFEKNNICHLVVTNNNESIGVIDIKCLK